MDVLYDPMARESPPIKKTKKVRNKLAHETCKYTSAKINCISSGRRCSCCGNLRCTPEPCGPLEPPSVEIQSPNFEKESSSGETEFCQETNHVEEVCVKKLSWELCKGIVEEKPKYSENEISCFIEIIKQKLRDSLNREGGGPLVCGSNVTAGEIFEARNHREASLENNLQKGYFMGDVCGASLTCDCLDNEEAHVAQNVDEEKIEMSKDSGQRPVQDICTFYKPIILRHEKTYQEYSHLVKSVENFETRSPKMNFKIGDIGRSEEIGKWGELDIADRLLAKHKQTISLKRSQSNKDDVVHNTSDKFDEPNRFSYLNKKDFAALCRQLFRWSDRLSKKWRMFNSQPHIVIHLLSIGYPSEIRRRASKSFDLLQNLQVARLGWLANKNAQILYILPNNQSPEMITLFRDLIKNVRPDVTENRLWVIQPDRKECFKTECLNGSQALFQNPKTYRRVKRLTAGRQAFVLPGVIEKIDVLIASELRVPIMGPPLEFQNYFLNKSNVANFLQKINVNQPPFVPDVYNFPKLCEGLAHLMITFPNYVTWLIKINYGISGLQTAVISLQKNFTREIIAAKTEKELVVFLKEILPGEMIVNKQAYKDHTEFFCDIEKYGGLVQGCPYVDYRVLSFGIFIEHDRATPEVCASADVFHTPHDLTTDLCYGIPQATTARLPLENLVVNVGIALRDESQYIGYFGMDVVALTDEDSMEKFLVVDIDPQYTDVIAFTDWVRFCLEVGSPYQCRQLSNASYSEKNSDRSQMNVKKEKGDPCGILKPENTMERYAICSGKLYSNGLAKYCGTTLVSLCEDRNVRYNFEIKQGSMICPIDSERRALGLVSLYPKRSRAIDEFAKSLRVLHELSLEMHNDKIKTNMLRLARALERQELGRTGKKKKNESSE